MKDQIRAVVLLTAVLFAGAAAADETAPAPAPHHHHHRKAAAHPASRHDYAQCVKEKTAVAEYFCGAHADACQAEKDAVAHQCRQEARGVRQKG
ncbi:MAG: hypothetical protein ISP90_10875 [Nevskia sp.]|nr:hypothetical protein [Nevskia sp.]